MDPITHTLAGATMARAGLDRRTPLATAALLLGANAPDIDIITAFFHEENASLACRRGWTHGPLAMAALPFAVAGLVVAWDRWVRRRRNPSATPASFTTLLALSVLGVFSHPALDWLNTYGIRLLMPFSDTWFRGESLFIIDPWLWLILGAGLYAARRARRAERPAWTFAKWSGAAGLAYIAAMIGLSFAGRHSTRAFAQSVDIKPVTQVLYSPRPGTPFRADIVIGTPDAYYPGSLAWTRRGAEFLVTGFLIPRGDWNHPAVQRARASPAARNYLVWAQYPYVRVDVNGADTTVVFGDARYRGMPAGSLSGMEVKLSALP
jgi:inner membrane protein